MHSLWVNFPISKSDSAKQMNCIHFGTRWMDCSIDFVQNIRYIRSNWRWQMTEQYNKQLCDAVKSNFIGNYFYSFCFLRKNRFWDSLLVKLLCDLITRDIFNFYFFFFFFFYIFVYNCLGECFCVVTCVNRANYIGINKPYEND